MNHSCYSLWVIILLFELPLFDSSGRVKVIWIIPLWLGPAGTKHKLIKQTKRNEVSHTHTTPKSPTIKYLHRNGDFTCYKLKSTKVVLCGEERLGKGKIRFFYLWQTKEAFWWLLKTFIYSGYTLGLMLYIFSISLFISFWILPRRSRPPISCLHLTQWCPPCLQQGQSRGCLLPHSSSQSWPGLQRDQRTRRAVTRDSNQH